MWNTSVNRKKRMAQRKITNAILGFFRANPPRGLTLPFAIRVKVCIEVVSPFDEPEVKLCDESCTKPDSHRPANLDELVIAVRKVESGILFWKILARKLPGWISNDEREKRNDEREDTPIVVCPVTAFEFCIDPFS